MKWILLLLVIAGVAGYFTRPDEAVMRERANTELNVLEEGFTDLGLGERAYSNYYVLAKYTVTLNNDPKVTCWGAFTQVQCNRAAEPAAAS